VWRPKEDILQLEKTNFIVPDHAISRALSENLVVQ
jgi:hypothetical protein